MEVKLRVDSDLAAASPAPRQGSNLGASSQVVGIKETVDTHWGPAYEYDLTRPRPAMPAVNGYKPRGAHKGGAPGVDPAQGDVQIATTPFSVYFCTNL